jgi:hypothetical protein
MNRFPRNKVTGSGRFLLLGELPDPLFETACGCFVRYIVVIHNCLTKYRVLVTQNPHITSSKCCFLASRSLPPPPPSLPSLTEAGGCQFATRDMSHMNRNGPILICVHTSCSHSGDDDCRKTEFSSPIQPPITGHFVVASETAAEHTRRVAHGPKIHP